MMRKLFLLTGVLILETSLCAQSWTWSTFDAGTRGNGSSVIRVETQIEIINKKSVETRKYTGEMGAQDHHGYAGVIITPDTATLTTLKTAKGVKFWVTGDGNNYQFMVETTMVTDGGDFGYNFTATKAKDTQVIIEFKSLAQESWAIQRAWDPNQMTKLKIQTLGYRVPPFHFKIWGLDIIR
jgi:hypothetical protein